MDDVFGEVVQSMPVQLVEPVERMINRDVRYRPTMQYFMSVSVFAVCLSVCLCLSSFACLSASYRITTGIQWSNYSIIYEGTLNMASDSEPRKFFSEAPSEVTFWAAKGISIGA